MFQELYELSKKKAQHTIWLISDLQQSNPVYARRCIDIAMTDYASLGLPAQMIWYLGDAVESDNLSHLREMSWMQVEAFDKLHLPLCYATGNHDYDYACRYTNQMPVLPFYEAVQKKNGWYTTQSCEDYYFTYQFGAYTVYFLCDHIAKDNKWCVTHGRVKRGSEFYPYTEEDALELRKKIAATPGPVILASHYAFPGGNRQSDMLAKLLPLPSNVRIHFYGHSHIGDFQWGQEHVYRKISWIDWHDIPQINVSSLDNIRGNACRSTFLHIYEDGTMGVFFRNHEAGCFTDCYFPSGDNMPNGYSKNWENPYLRMYPGFH